MWELRHARDGWAIESGQYEKSAGGQKKGLPDWYLKQPGLFRGDRVYLDAFWELSSTRNYAGGPIPWNRLTQYAEKLRLDSGMTLVFEAVVRELDETYRSWMAEQKRNRAPKPARRQHRRR